MQKKTARIVCGECGYVMPIQILPNAECKGITVRCKNTKCRKIIEIKVKDGIQSR